MAKYRCPACSHAFTTETEEAELRCPECNVRFAPKRKAVAGAPAGSAPAPGTKGKATILRTCAACGAKYPGEQSKCPECGVGYTAGRIAKQEAETGGTFGAEKKGIQAGVAGGILMLVIAAVWFFVGLSLDRIFFYPPILAVIGIYAIIKGLATGNLAGEKRQPRRRRA